MEEKILQKLEEHDRRFDKHDRRFDKHDHRFDEHDRRFDRIEKRLDDHDQKLDKLIDVAVDHGERLARIEETMVTKTDFRHLVGLIENLATDVKTIKEDHMFAIEWLKRLQEHVDRQERDIQMIKLKLQMA